MFPELSSCSFDSFEIIKIPEPGEKCYKNLQREFSKNQGSALIIVYTKIGAEKFHEDKVNIEKELVEICLLATKEYSFCGGHTFDRAENDFI